MKASGLHFLQIGGSTEGGFSLFWRGRVYVYRVSQRHNGLYVLRSMVDCRPYHGGGLFLTAN